MKRPALAVSVALLTTIFWRCPVGLAHPLLVHGTGHTGQVVGAFPPRRPRRPHPLVGSPLSQPAMCGLWERPPTSLELEVARRGRVGKS